MKKKFLSLMMAAAVVATTSVSAFADTTADTTVVENLDSTDGTANVTITGNVTDEQDNMPATAFRVTVPTTASFTVNKSVGFIGTDLEVKNEGTQQIEVYAQNFSRTKGGTGTINIVPQSALSAPESKTRADVALRLEGEGTTNTAYLGAEGKGSGVYDAENLETPKAEGVKLLTLSAGDKNAQKGKILLRGLAGKKEVAKAISNNFQLTLRIKKVMNEDKKVTGEPEQ
ncbi:hypothetical protein [Clostridium sp. 29_15]|uniref:hypothetical protein n=1 Tax=Clostridium sp. 29_15 TaxID=1896982 RepID=UPI0009672814|nr:hypothetical protein [Clostridium sp. 29_15]OKZ87366.1 MAG: hypothetical protein BHW04_05810 [Clostridium sp. 29_15]